MIFSTNTDQNGAPTRIWREYGFIRGMNIDFHIMIPALSWSNNIWFAGQADPPISQVPNDCYFFTFQSALHPSNLFSLTHNSSGTPIVLRSVNYDFVTNVWYRLRVKWAANGDIDVGVRRLDTNDLVIQFVENEDTLSSGTIGLRVGSPLGGD